MNKYRVLIVCCLLSGFVFSCKRSPEVNEKPLARYGDDYLYLSDIKHTLPKELKNADSVAFIDSYIKKWIMDKLMFEKASLNISDDQDDIEEKVEAFRQSLYVFKYEQRLLSEKVNSKITDEEVDVFYKEHQLEFVLNENIIKPYYLVFPSKIIEPSKIIKLVNSNKENDYDELKDYCYKYAVTFLMPEKWISAGSLINEMPDKNINFESSLRSHQVISQKDTSNTYILKAYEFVPSGNVAPIDYVVNDIKQIIVQKRTQELQKSLRNKMFDDALKRNQIEIYTK